MWIAVTVFIRRRLCHSEWRIISGQWVKRDPVDLALKYTLTDPAEVTNSQQNLSILTTLMLLNCGIWSLCNLTGNFKRTCVLSISVTYELHNSYLLLCLRICLPPRTSHITVHICLTIMCYWLSQYLINEHLIHTII